MQCINCYTLCSAHPHLQKPCCVMSRVFDCLSRSTFSYFTNVVSQAYHSALPLELHDIDPLEESESVAVLLKRYTELKNNNNNTQHTKKQSSLAWTLFSMGRGELARAAGFEVLHIVASLSFPMVLRAQLNDLEEGGSQGWVWALVGVCVTLVSIISNQKHIDIAFRVGIRLKALCSVLVFNTALHRRNAVFDARGDTTGKVLNLVSSDASKLQDLCPVANLLWGAPVQILVSTILISMLIGPAGLIGVLFLGIAMPALNTFMMVRVSKYRKSKMKISDERVKLCSEMLAGIRVVKYLSWEVRFVERIMNVRLDEMKWVSKELHLFASYIVILISFPMLSLLVCFISYILINPEVPLTPGNAFAALSLFNVLRFPLMQMGTVLSAAAQARVAVDRIEKFISKDSSVSQNSKLSDKNDQIASPSKVEMVNESKAKTVAKMESAVFGWCGNDGLKESSIAETHRTTRSDFVLGPITMSLQSCEIVAVVGSVGSGKSMLVASILGETTLRAGSYDAHPGCISFVPQNAWIINASVQQNITGFAENEGHIFDKSLYEKVVAACSLKHDILEMPDRDQQVIGERGVTLSGGQKQRIALARSAYTILYRRKAAVKDDIHGQEPGNFMGLVLFDDPLSALDSATARHVFDELLGPKGLLKNVARMLVTHAVQFLSQCNRVFLLHNGAFVNVGPFSKIQEFKLKNDAEGLSLGGEKDAVLAAIAELSSALQENGGGKDDESIDQLDDAFRNRTRSTTSEKSIHLLDVASKDMESGETGGLMTAESQGKGSIDFHVVRYFFSTMGGYICFFVPLGLFFVAERTTYVGTDWWLSLWTDAANSTPSHVFEDAGLHLPAAPDAEGQRFYAIRYAIFVLCAALFVVARLHWFAHGYVRTARKFFARLIVNSVKAPMVFFETTPLGRITNRYSYDTEVIDAQLFQRTNGVVASTSWLLGGIGVIVGSIPLMTLILVPVFLAYFYLYRFYRRACVELQRLAAVTRSPIHSTFQETLSGSDSVRAFGVELTYSRKNASLVDKHSRASVALQVASRWLSIRLETLGVMVVAGAAFLSYLIPGISAGIAGLAIMWASQLSMSLQFNTINLTEAESLMTSVERVLEYIKVEQEPAADTPKENVPPKDWPSRGEVRFENAVLCYRDGLPPALNGLTATVPAGKKVGVCGYTGAGKSTIATALFRLRDLSSGKILVDDIDISSLGLNDVRGRGANGMAIITQDPLVFSGPIRFTLDPFDQYSDEDIWSALEKVQMRRSVIQLWKSRGDTEGDPQRGDSERDQELDDKTLKRALELPIAEAGRNLSVGQRQLLCFARALLLRPRILILDEATASVDYATDRVIQTTLRENFPGVTMLIIAHRLETIIDLDAVMVMDAGKCVEYGTPKELLSKKSLFSGLVDATGVDTAKKLRHAALNSNINMALPGSRSTEV